MRALRVSILFLCESLLRLRVGRRAFLWSRKKYFYNFDKYSPIYTVMRVDIKYIIENTVCILLMRKCYLNAVGLFL